MGQPISITGSTITGDVAVIATDRSLTGQDGVGFDSAEAAEALDTFPAALAGRLFAGDSDITHVFVASNQVVVGRAGRWDEAALQAAEDVVAAFFVFYGEGSSAGGAS